MSGWGWPSHGEDKLSQIKQCYTEGDRKQQCPLCALRAENERLRSGVRSYYNALLNYGRHWPDCATPKSGDRCNCGLNGWLTEKAFAASALVAPPEGK